MVADGDGTAVPVGTEDTPDEEVAGAEVLTLLVDHEADVQPAGQ